MIRACVLLDKMHKDIVNKWNQQKIVLLHMGFLMML